MEQFNASIAITPERAEYYNQRSLIQAFLGQYEAALEDIQTNKELNDGELLPNVNDSRAFIYPLQGDYKTAKHYYEEIYRENYRSAYPLLGGGIAYAHLGDWARCRGRNWIPSSLAGRGPDGSPGWGFLLHLKRCQILRSSDPTRQKTTTKS